MSRWDGVLDVCEYMASAPGLRVAAGLAARCERKRDRTIRMGQGLDRAIAGAYEIRLLPTRNGYGPQWAVSTRAQGECFTPTIPEQRIQEIERAKEGATERLRRKAKAQSLRRKLKHASWEVDRVRYRMQVAAKDMSEDGAKAFDEELATLISAVKWQEELREMMMQLDAA